VQNVPFVKRGDLDMLDKCAGNPALEQDGSLPAACRDSAVPWAAAAVSSAPSRTHGPVRNRSVNPAQRAVIRILDITLALAALAFLAPLLLLLAGLVVAWDPGPVLFSHRRIGKHGNTFFCLKFRSMAIDSEARLRDLLLRDPAARAEWDRDQKLREDPRIIGIGRFLRKWSLDELPQLVNVLRGEMSLVGPRPIVSAEAERYGRYFSNYCSMKPGITGLWQICGRSDVSYRRRVALDVKLSKIMCVKTYLKILLATPLVLATAKGAF